VKGNSIYFCFGKNAGFRIEWTAYIKRIVLWRFAIAYMPLDIEILHSHLFDNQKEKV
jgi:hypothetical protein